MTVVPIDGILAALMCALTNQARFCFAETKPKVMYSLRSNNVKLVRLPYSL